MLVGAAATFARTLVAGHWHHFWTGSKSKPESRKVVLRWLHPMLVGRSDEPDTTTVHPVQ